MFRSILLGSSALALVAIAITPARAQSEAFTTLPPIDVTASPTGSLTVPSVQEQRQMLMQTPGSVEWVDSESLKGTYTNNLRDVLKDVPGVWVQTRYGQEMRLSVRGSGIGRAFHTRGIEILQDGIPFLMADGSGDFYQIDPLAMRSADVYKGGNALMFGTSTLGGAINFVSPTAQTAIAPNIIRFDAGSFGTWRGNFQVSRDLGDVDFMVNGTVSHADGFRNHSRQQYEQFNANVGYRISPDVETRFYFGVYITDQQLPGTLSLQQALTNPTQASAAAVSGNQARNVRTERIANRTTVRLGTGQLDFDTWFMHKNLYHPIFQVIDQDGYTYGFAPRYTISGLLGGLRNDFVMGGRFFGGNNRALQYINIKGSRGAQTVNSRQNAWNLDGYAENRLFVLPELAAVLGAKIFYAERQYTNFGNLPPFSTVYQNNNTSYSGVNPKVGLLWEPKKDIQAFVNVTRSQDVPDFSDLTQTQANGSTSFVPLQAQKAWTLEIGTRGRYDRYAWDVTFYRSWVDGQMLQYTTNPSVPATTFNAGRTNLMGIELGASVDLVRDIATQGDALTLAQLWNWSNFRFNNDPQYGNNRIAGIPEHVLRTSLTYRHPSGFYVSPAIDLVPTGAWVDYANTQQVPAYMLVGVQAGYEFKNGVFVYLDARNLTNNRYISDFGTVTRYSATGTQTFYPGDGRAIYVGTRASF
ncbi:MAG: TonB-dependent receptor family protein [Acetobacteraceae bacterium]